MIKCKLCHKQIIKTCHNKKYCDNCKYKTSYYSSGKRKADYIKNKELYKTYYINKREIYLYNARTNTLLKKYRMTREDVIIMLKKQNNKCVICGCELKKGRCTHIDHNHRTKKVRGILCLNCNVGLGKFNDSIHLLQKAISYLDEHDDEVRL